MSTIGINFHVRYCLNISNFITRKTGRKQAIKPMSPPKRGVKVSTCMRRAMTPQQSRMQQILVAWVMSLLGMA